MTQERSFMAVVGPTGSGKTAVCEAIAARLACEVISCDSMQIYRRMPILSQASEPVSGPGGIPVHLCQFLEPSEEFSAAQFRLDAGLLVKQIASRGRLPLIAGGTGLYLRALLDGLFDLPVASKDKALRAKLIDEEQRLGPGELHRRLLAVDPPAAAKIHANDIRRLVRALEVYLLSGVPISEHKSKRSGIRGDYFHRIFFLSRCREDLYRRIDARVDRMVKDGLFDEVRGLLKGPLSLTARMALGIRQVEAALCGKMTAAEAVETLKRQTRNYAKRQISWFKHEQGVETISVEESATPQQIAADILERWTMAVTQERMAR